MRDRIGVADEERAPPGVLGSFQYRVNAVALVVAYFVVALLVRYADAPALQPSFGLFVDGSTLLQPPLGLSLIKRRQSQWPSLGLMLIEPPQAHQQFTLELGSAFPLGPTVSVPRTRIATGVASWYGSESDGRPTANGEVYDMFGLSAASRTLPLSSVVRVTNLDNGRSVVLRVNDRGPYVDGRILDLSRGAAEVLGMERRGHALVRIDAL